MGGAESEKERKREKREGVEGGTEERRREGEVDKRGEQSEREHMLNIPCCHLKLKLLLSTSKILCSIFEILHAAIPTIRCCPRLDQGGRFLLTKTPALSLGGVCEFEHSR